MKVYKTYILICPIEKIVRYVGITYQTLENRFEKGGGHLHPRKKDNPHKYYWTKNLKKQGLIPEIKLICDNLTEKQACRSEKELIFLYRHLIGDKLLNIADGGRIGPGMKDKKHSEKTKEKMRKSKLGEKHPNFGKSRSLETKKKISKALSGEKHPNFGKKSSEKTKEKMRKARIGKFLFEETKIKISKRKKGKSLSEEHKKNLSKSHLGKKLSKEHKRKIGKSLLGNKNAIGS